MSIADIRREYLGQPLSETESDPNPLRQFERWFAQVRELEPDATEMALATATRDGRPSVRTVLLKGIDDRGFVFYTADREPLECLRVATERGDREPRLARVALHDRAAGIRRPRTASGVVGRVSHRARRVRILAGSSESSPRSTAVCKGSERRMATRTPGTLSTRRWRFVGVFVLVTALAFGVSVWLGGMSTESVLVSATVGLTLGLVSVPVLMPLNFTSPTLW